MGAAVKGRYYPSQLRVAGNPDDKDFIFEIEKVEKKEKRKGKEWLFVKYLYYPSNHINYFIWNFMEMLKNSIALNFIYLI